MTKDVFDALEHTIQLKENARPFDAGLAETDIGVHRNAFKKFVHDLAIVCTKISQKNIKI